MENITASEKQICAAFTEWDRRFRENPEQFMSQAESLLKGTPASYGDAATPYFLSILREVNSAGVIVPPSLAGKPS